MKYHLYEKKEIKSDKKRLYTICDIIHEKTYKFVFYENMNEEFSKHEKFKQFAAHVCLIPFFHPLQDTYPRHEPSAAARIDKAHLHLA